MRIVCLSDTHERHRELVVPEGDLLVHAGDFTNRGEIKAILDFARWMGEQPHPYKIVIPGNHDLLFEKDWNHARILMNSSGAHLLNAESVKVMGLRIWGEPRQPEYHRWAFNVPREDMQRVWSRAPRQLDILVTHGPPVGVGDRDCYGDRHGDVFLRHYIEEVQPRLVVCGHNHRGYGTYRIGCAIVVNAANCDQGYNPTQAPIVVELDA